MVCENEEHAKPSTTGRIQSESRSNPEGCFSCSADPRRWRGKLWPGIFYHVYWDPRRSSVERGQSSRSCLWTQSGAILLGAALGTGLPREIGYNFSPRLGIWFIREISDLTGTVKIFPAPWLLNRPPDTPSGLILVEKRVENRQMSVFAPLFDRKSACNFSPRLGIWVIRHISHLMGTVKVFPARWVRNRPPDTLG